MGAFQCVLVLREKRLLHGSYFSNVGDEVPSFVKFIHVGIWECDIHV